MEKVFCIGMYKTGTTSLGNALNRLGFKVFHGSSPYLRVGIDPFNWSSEAFVPHLDRVKNLVSLFDAFEDYPFMFIYKEMQEAYPDAKFILSERDSIKVAQSDINMWKQIGRTPIPDTSVFVERYERHHAAVLEHFGDSDQLLRMNLSKGDGWEKLCDFLQLPVPKNIPFPRAHRRPYGLLGRAVYRVARRVKDMYRYR